MGYYDKLIKIPSGKNVEPNGNILSNDWNEIDKIHIIKQLKGKITIYSGTSTITYEPTAFICGGIYEIVIHKITFEDGTDEGSIIGMTGKKNKQRK
jgi:hypothetical protein